MRINKHHFPQAASLPCTELKQTVNTASHIICVTSLLSAVLPVTSLAFNTLVRFCSTLFMSNLVFRFFHIACAAFDANLMSHAPEVEAVSASAEQLSSHDPAPHQVRVHARHQPERH